MKTSILAFFLVAATPSAAQPGQTAAVPPVGPAHKQIEIYRIAPGQHEAFLRFIALCDKANQLAGLPPRDLYVHSDGADWDFILIQPAETPPDKQAALDAAWKKLGMPSGINFFIAIRKFIAEHSDTSALGPTTAADYLAGLTPTR